jgi:hypothetical protein
MGGGGIGEGEGLTDNHTDAACDGVGSVSRDRSAPDTVDTPSANAANTSARLVIDFDPGSSTRARTGPSTAGALHPVTPKW